MDEIMTEGIDWDSRLIISPDYVLREIGGESIVVPVGETDPFDNAVLMLNETAAWLWHQFTDGATPNEVLERAGREFEEQENESGLIRYSIGRFVSESIRYKVLQSAGKE